MIEWFNWTGTGSESQGEVPRPKGSGWGRGHEDRIIWGSGGLVRLEYGNPRAGTSAGDFAGWLWARGVWGAARDLSDFSNAR